MAAELVSAATIRLYRTCCLLLAALACNLPVGHSSPVGLHWICRDSWRVSHCGAFAPSHPWEKMERWGELAKEARDITSVLCHQCKFRLVGQRRVTL